MVFTMIGGGAHRLLSTVRHAIDSGAFREGGELRFYDLDAARAQVMAEMVRKSPEYRANPAEIAVRWELTLEQALEGADVVSVTLLAGGAYAMNLSSELGWSYGFLGSDNVSFPGAFLALRGAPILLLDEATSALDEKTEAQVLKNLLTALPDTACILTTHRPGALKYCTRLYKAENGALTCIEVNKPA